MIPTRFVRTLLFVALGFFLGVGVARSNAPFRFPAPKKFDVGASKPARIVRGATVTGGASYTVTRLTTCINPDGSQTVGLSYTNAAGQIVSTRTALIDSGCTKVLDNFGNVISATGPSTECSAAVTFTGQVDTTIGSAATGGKLAL